MTNLRESLGANLALKARVFRVAFHVAFEARSVFEDDVAVETHNDVGMRGAEMFLEGEKSKLESGRDRKRQR